MQRRILLRIARLLLVSALVAGGPTDTKNAAYFKGAFAQELPTKGDLIKGDVKPYGQVYVFEIRRGVGNKIIDGYDAQTGDKIRLLDFGLTDFNPVQGMMQQVGNDVQLRLPGGQILWILKTQIGSLDPNTFQLELDRRGLIPTFADEFNEFSWYAEGLNNRPEGRGTWRTNFGYAPVQHLGSRTLGSNGELQVYSDRGFRGTASAPLGIEPFRIVNGTLEIVADKAPESVKPFISNYEYTSGLITTQFSFSQVYGQPSGSYQRIDHGLPKSILLKFLGRSRPCFIPMHIARRPAYILMLRMSFVFQTHLLIFIHMRSIGKKMRSDGISTASRSLAPQLQQTCTSQCTSWQVFRSEDIGSVDPMNPPTSLPS
jgi:hypothetical protein